MRSDDPRLRRFGNEVDKVFVEFLRGDWVPRTGSATFCPVADVYYHPQEEAVVVRLELPGIDPDRITLEIEGSTLRVSGCRQDQRPADAVYHQMEIAYGRFERLVALPPDVDITRASADYISGYLEISLPTKQKSQSRQIPITQVEDGEAGERQ